MVRKKGDSVMLISKEDKKEDERVYMIRPNPKRTNEANLVKETNKFNNPIFRSFPPFPPFFVFVFITLSLPRLLLCALFFHCLFFFLIHMRFLFLFLPRTQNCVRREGY